MPAPQSPPQERTVAVCSACSLPAELHRLGLDEHGVIVAGVMLTPTAFRTCSEWRHAPPRVLKVLPLVLADEPRPATARVAS